MSRNRNGWIYFNPRSREGSDSAAACHTSFSSGDFNPRSREGSDGGIAFRYPPHYSFQSTLPRGERPLLSSYLKPKLINFNPRSREGSDKYSAFRVFVYSNFNPRSREGSDKMDKDTRLLDIISIHAPARGATSVNFLSFIRVEFQSTLPRGERHLTST